MVSRNIDLTEHRDFSNNISLNSISQVLLREIDCIEENDIMSTDEYNILWNYHSIFGFKRHTNMAEQIFKTKERKFKEDYYSHCERCGKLIRIPWRRIYDLCEKCNNVMETTTSDGKIKFPWDIEITSSSRDDTMDIFRLR